MYVRCVFIYLFFITINCLLKANSLEINFSHSSGYYTSSFDLIINANASSADVYYSINTPVALGNANIYDSSIRVNSTIIVNAMSILNEDTTYKSNAFLFIDDIKTSNNFSPHITEKAVYKNLIDSAFHSIATVCLNTTTQFSVTDTISPTEVAASIVFILPNHSSKSVSVNCGLQTWGGSPSNPKKNYRLEFKDKYGPSKLNFDLFKHQNKNEKVIKTASKFDRLLLRAGSQDGLNAEYGNEAEAQFIKNRFVYDVVLKMGLPAPHGFFTHVFVNNKYAGVYHLMEAPDEYFFKTYFFNNHKKDNIEIRKNRDHVNKPVEPTYYSTLLSYSNGLNVEGNYKQLGNFINIDAAATYITYHHFFNNFDWSDFQNTILAAVPFEADGKFIFCPWDFDFSLGAKGNFTNTYVYDRHGAVPENLFNSTEFKFLQGDKVACYCMNDGELTHQNLKELYTARSEEVKVALIAEAAKWGNTNFNGLNGNIEVTNWEPNLHWENQRQLILNEYLTNRTNDFIEDYKELDRFTSVLPVQVQYNEEGIQLINPNNYGKIFYTLDGTDPRGFGGSVNSNAFTYRDETIRIEKPAKLIARVYVTTNIDVRWSNFCPVNIYPEQAYNQIVINEIHYKPISNTNALSSTKNYEFIELKNNSDNTVFLQDVQFNQGIHYKFKEADSLEANQLFVLASDSAGFNNKYGFSANGVFKGNLNNDGEMITIISPNCDTIDQVNFGSIAPWPVLDDTIENSIALLNTELDNALAANWKTSPINFTPGLDNNFCSHNPISLATNVSNISCFNKNDGVANVSISGGEKPYSTLWSNGETSSNITNLKEGNYNVLVQDAFYCKATGAVKVENPVDISIDFLDNFAFVKGGQPPYKYLWSNGETGKKLNTKVPGSYKLTITDFNNCVKEKTKLIIEAPACNSNIKPENLVAHNVTSISAILYWSAITDGVNIVKYKSENDKEWRIYETTRTMAVLYNLKKCTTYYWTITFNCKNGGNGIESDTISFKTKGC